MRAWEVLLHHFNWGAAALGGMQQAKTSDTYGHANVGFNGPRAGINFNDGFGGNSTLYKNLLFNFCRESGDHGPFNSWDRQLYVTYKGAGTTGFYTDYNHLTQNFLLANYESSQGIDNDDGSAVSCGETSLRRLSLLSSTPMPVQYYNSSFNFLFYGGAGMKSEGRWIVLVSTTCLLPPAFFRRLWGPRQHSQQQRVRLLQPGLRHLQPDQGPPRFVLLQPRRPGWRRLGAFVRCGVCLGARHASAPSRPDILEQYGSGQQCTTTPTVDATVVHDNTICEHGLRCSCS